jgi:hypothetical protein
MNSHERRVVERRWPYAIDINYNNDLLDECLTWLHDNFGTCYFSRKNNPRWCWRPNYSTQEFGNFSYHLIGAQLYFRRKEDYSWFLLRWENGCRS